jgi:Ca-activated chloride channel family protein
MKIIINKTLKRFIVSILFILSMLSVYAQHENKDIRNGNKLYEEKKFIAAERKYKDALMKNKSSNEAGFNLGDALYEQKKYDAAADQFIATAKSSKDKNIQSQAYHNLGNAYLKNQKFEESINAYKNALKLNPEDDDTRYNLAYAKSKLIQQQQQNKSKDKNQDNNKNKDKKEQDNQDSKDNKDKENKDKKEQQDKKESEENKKKEEEQKQAQQNPKMSKEDAERLLNALNNKEKDLHDKLKKKSMQGARVQIEKDW